MRINSCIKKVNRKEIAAMDLHSLLGRDPNSLPLEKAILSEKKDYAYP